MLQVLWGAWEPLTFPFPTLRQSKPLHNGEPYEENAEDHRRRKSTMIGLDDDSSDEEEKKGQGADEGATMASPSKWSFSMSDGGWCCCWFPPLVPFP